LYTGLRWSVRYRLEGAATVARALADDLCIEQTVEFPRDLVTDPDIRGHVFGRVEDLRAVRPGVHEAVISYAAEIVGTELTQLVCVIFGNASLKPGVRVESIELPAAFATRFRGPRFGREGLRTLLGAPDRALLCSAIKPMGLSVEALADMAYRMARGGMDLIKDDHGLADQPFCRFEERVKRCAEAVAKANLETGGSSRYLPNVTAPFHLLESRARFAKAAGAGGFLHSPMVGGLDTMRWLADADDLALPVLSHPALQGSFLLNPQSGMSHRALIGQLSRLGGADAAVFPSFGGRFSFSRQDSRQVMEGTSDELGGLKPIFPVPAGGMSLRRVGELLDFYGNDVILLIGGDLHREAEGLEKACARFRELVGK